MLRINLFVFCAVWFLASCTAISTTTNGTTKNLSNANLQNLVKLAGAPLFEGMGEFTHPVTTSDPYVQRYFDQGMVLAFGFNHAESVRAFKAAQVLDPGCAMCYWGEALAIGPNINVTAKGKAIMMPPERIAAYAAIQNAVALKDKVSAVERDYIEALAARYNGDVESAREPLDLAYALKMKALAEKYPDDDDAAALFAEALMNTMPWDYWSDDGSPKQDTVLVINSLQKIMDRSPKHPLALHLYIHAVEASSNPGRAEIAADTLADLVPGSGHLVHMPSHIYWRIGRYHDASEANVRAAKVDEDYIAACNAQGFYPALYYPHNIHFLWAASSMEGRSAVAIEAARKVAANIRLEQIEQFPTIEFFHTIPLLALTQFAKWDEVLAEPQPEASLEFSNAIWRYARGVALARLGKVALATAESEALQPLLQTDKILFLDGNDYPASIVLKIADQLLSGEIAMAGADHRSAVAAFEKAVIAQDSLPYTEPPFWYYPTRQSLGEALFKKGDTGAAEAVYKEDLKRYPRNGWSMFGLIQSLEAQNKADEAAEVRAKFDNVWSRSDVTLSGSRL
ncbi:MAG: tetratricopeptide (TPR) repeat protein [Arenicella sp.]|jgi:tetratricopeptide (TPR) repeat protein